jgi:hypothetical protein
MMLLPRSGETDAADLAAPSGQDGRWRFAPRSRIPA